MTIEKRISIALRSIQDSETAHILRGIYSMIDKRFTQRGFDIYPNINKASFSMKYQDVHYTMEFFRKDMQIRIIAEYPIERTILIEEVSNATLDKTEYLRDKKIINADCRLECMCAIKKMPKNDESLNNFCDQLWGFIIKPMMSGIKSNRK